MDLVSRINSLTAHGAGWVLWLLVVLSIAGLAVIFERAVFFVTSRGDVATIRNELRSLLTRGDLDEARRRLEESPCFEAQIAAAGLGACGAGSAEERMRGQNELARLTMERNLVYLGTLGSNAPFVGLLGTVIGIIRAFQELDRSGAKLSTGLMAEIGEALVATAVGLLVALPAVAAFNYFRRVIQARLGQSEVLTREVLAHLKATHELSQERAVPAE